MASSMIRVLLVEDDGDYVVVFKKQLEGYRQQSFRVEVVRELSAALISLQKQPFDVIILDLTLPDAEGIEALKILHQRHPAIPVIVITGHDNNQLAVQALEYGAEEYLVKWEVETKLLERIIRYAIGRRKVMRDLRQNRKEQEIILDSVPAMILYKDRENRILKVNRFGAELLGLPVEMIQGKTAEDLFPEAAAQYFKQDLEVIASGKPKYGIIEYLKPRQSEGCWIKTDIVPHWDEKGEIAGVIVFSLDISERKKFEEDLLEREKRLVKQNRVLVELAKSHVMHSGDLNTMLAEVTKAACHTLEVHEVSIWLYRDDGMSLYCADLYDKESDAHQCGAELNLGEFPKYIAALENNRFIGCSDVATDPRLKDYAERYLIPKGIRAVLNAPIRVNGKAVGVICHKHRGEPKIWALEDQNFVASIADLIALSLESSEKRRVQERLNHLAYYDPLTDLPNRVLFIDRLNQAILYAKRYEKHAAVLFFDLDHFKRINETLGHALGDVLLVQVASRIQRELGEGDTLTYVGGDEFTILLPEVEKSSDVAHVAEKIFASFKEPFHIHSHELYMTSSMGIAVFPSDGLDSVTLMKNADTALFQAKEKGRNNYRFYSSAMSVKAFEKLILENNLRRALEKDELEIYYQPLINSYTEEVAAVEALLRWRHPSLGLIGPVEFIPMAEETGLIVPMGEWVLRRACKQVKSWHGAGFKPVRLTVNISDRQFENRGFLSTIKSALEESALNAMYLELELTETMLMKHADESLDHLSELKAMGVTISIDDFGSGYSSLSYLKRFPIDCLKIDRAFIRDLTEDNDDAAIAKAILAMAHSLKLRVVAEGVETKEQIAFLKAYQCDFMQGFAFSRPVPPQDAVRFLGRPGRQSDASTLLA
ncbi:MAG: EAL domain-containing protein [Candidatus Omnitrophota bacterium]